MRTHVWIVEIDASTTATRKWEPTVGCGLTKEDGEQVLNDWESQNPDDTFRLTKYEAVR